MGGRYVHDTFGLDRRTAWVMPLALIGYSRGFVWIWSCYRARRGMVNIPDGDLEFLYHSF